MAYQFVQLWQGLESNKIIRGIVVGLVLQEQWILEFIQGMIESKMHWSFLDGCGQLPDEVFFGSNSHGIPSIRIQRWPISKAIMMFAREYNVASSSFDKQLSPICRIVETSSELRSEILIRKRWWIVFFHKLDNSGHISLPTMPKPSSTIGWDGKDTPVDENSDFGLIEPGRIWTRV